VMRAQFSASLLQSLLSHDPKSL